MATEQIASRNSLFLGELVDKPRPALVIGENADGAEIYECPDCGSSVTFDECGVVGAEPGCAFCSQCSCEFEVA